MSQAAIILEPITYGRQRRSLANALAQAGLQDGEADPAEEAVIAPPSRDLMDMEADPAGVYGVVDAEVGTDPLRTAGSTQVRTQTRSGMSGRRFSTWMPARFKSEPLDLMDDPQRAAELPWLKAKKKGRVLRKLKAFAAWIGTLAVIGAILAGAAHSMGLTPWAKHLAEVVARL